MSATCDVSRRDLERAGRQPDADVYTARFDAEDDCNVVCPAERRSQLRDREPVLCVKYATDQTPLDAISLGPRGRLLTCGVPEMLGVGDGSGAGAADRAQARPDAVVGDKSVNHVRIGSR